MSDAAETVPRGLYAITPDDMALPELLIRVDAALRGGVRLLQYRDKRRDAAGRKRAAEALRDLCTRHDAILVINDDLTLALAIDAGGLHLGADDGDLADARRALPRGKLLGASCYADFARARAAVAAGADYVAFGAAYPSPTKPLAPLAPHRLFARSREELGVPACAIGGITLDNAPSLVAAGADLIAVISDLFTVADSAEIERRARAYQRLFEENP
jgi:thiamine-phosphate pyrophosphorylase